MSEFSLKAYYEKQFEGISIDIAESTMREIHRIKGTVRKRNVKLVGIVAVIMVLIMGCGYLGVSTFFGPEGQLLWEVRTDTISERHAIAHYEVFESLDLSEGDVAYILLEKENNPEGIVDISQKPWVIEEFATIQEQLNEELDALIADAYEGYSFSRADGYSIFSEEKNQDIIESLQTRIEDATYVYEIVPTTLNDITSYYLYYTSKDNGLTITLAPWLGNVVHYTTSHEREGQVLEVQGYEGRVSRDEDGVYYEIVIEQRYLSIHCSDQNLSNESLSLIIKDILNL